MADAPTIHLFHATNAAGPDLARPASSTPAPRPVDSRATELLDEHRRAIWRRTDRLFAGLLAFEWLVGVILAAVRSPFTYDGVDRSIHPHLWMALLLGGCVVALPIWMALTMPARRLTRHIIAVAQMLMTGIFIHLGGGRIEMHFHIFGSLAFLAFYRDWRVLITASVVVAADHLIRGLFLPETIYGISVISGWRTLEHAGWVVFEDIFLIAACVQADREMHGIARDRALLEESYQEVEQKIVERTRQLKEAQDDLVRTARTAGMAEIATSVLHNVGNVLNSVNVSANVVGEKLRQSEVNTLAQVSALITEHKPDLARFLDQDERGRMIPDFLAELTACLHEEQRVILAEVESLSKGVDHIKHIVAAQQTTAKKTDMRKPVEPAKLLENAVALQPAAHRAEAIEFVREVAPDLPAAAIDEHKTLQILINLIRNARQAVASRGAGETKRITLGIHVLQATPARPPMIRFGVTDTGVGIAPENLARIFAHGFTTKQDGHGFGLHSAANAAREMGGSLTASSDGVGKGSTFVLDLPLTADPQESVACSR